MSVMDKFGLKRYCSIVTGAAMGLGKAMAEALAEAGSDIVIADINLEAAEKSADKIRALGVGAMAVRNDVTKMKDASHLAKKQ